MSDHVRRWEELLDPEITRERLISASLYIAAFEILKQSICDRIRDFYCFGFGVGGDLIDPKYQAEVLSRNRSRLYASLSWLQENDVLEQSDIESFERVKATRNALAHNLQGLVFGELPSTHVQLFPELVKLIRKIETWWVVNVEIPTNPDYDGQEVLEEHVVPGPVIMLQLMQEVASGNAEFLAHYKRNRG
ncbi:hypothetical protein ASD68_10855 [Rhodanobacter sp. Root627]|uniref:hypothetical protein n=1 Tax=Rhodanobacter sp. Root627 TaxID=1736572 RepID=UPI0006FA2E56|nr:hypothetical protein [Rhodanobacter sp. Root627]KRA33477.1 hypothetical protein ASD68_10855 [Rhodanobacter sp. Root627]